MLGQVVGSVFGQKAGGILNAIGSFASALAPLFGGRKGGISESGATAAQEAQVIGMARGGSGRFGGRGGVDRNVLSLNNHPIARVSRGEYFSVSPKGGGGSQVQIVPSPYFNVVVDGRAANVAGPMAGRAAMAGAAGGHQSVMRQQRRQIP